MTCFLQYTKSGDEEFLEGTYTSMNVNDSSNCGRGTVFLHKVPASDFYTEPFVAKREKEIAASRPPAVKPEVHAGPLHKPGAAKPNPGATAGTKRPLHPPAP